MILKDVAEMTDSISQQFQEWPTANSFRLISEFFHLKFFFFGRIADRQRGRSIDREIKRILQDCIENEQKRKPLTDESLTDICRKRGYQIARRTVAKYREQLNIPVGKTEKGDLGVLSCTLNTVIKF